MTANELNLILEAYGVDVVNHNSEFAVVPEPGTLLLAAIALLEIAVVRR